MVTGEVTDLKEFHKDNTVDFIVKLKDEVSSIDIEKKFKLSNNLSCNNLVLFNQKHQIKKYSDEVEILNEFFDLRLEYYGKRKEHQLSVLSKEMAVLENKARFITEINNGKLSIQNCKKDQVIAKLVNGNYKTQAQLDGLSSTDQTYEYLLGMSLWSLTLEKVETLRD